VRVTKKLHGCYLKARSDLIPAPRSTPARRGVVSAGERPWSSACYSPVVVHRTLG
jgi:hypothetical protein